MLKSEFRNMLRERKQVEMNDAYGTEKYRKLETELLSKNISETISFLEKECTGDEFVWISEVFEEVAIETQSREFIDCLWRVADKFPEECKEYNIAFFIKDANDQIEDV